ncbi:MAG TPA: hypothetical protein VKX45_20185, partial [Bryobacteraceae bacterium]|nr:hypothetical protein [Bryobacteraceae bacterium]
EEPVSSRRTAAIFISRVNVRRDNPMTQFSIQWKLCLNRLSQKSGQVHPEVFKSRPCGLTE